MSRKALDWFLTERGKTFASVLVGGATTFTLLANVLPHTLLVSTYRDIIRLYNKGLSVPVPKKVIERFDKTLELLEIPDYAKSDFKPFMTSGFDVYSLGTMGRFGVHVAIPVNFTYDSEMDIDKSRIKVNLESVVWESDAGKRLLNSLVLSENAQMYAMAREIKLRASLKIFFDTFYAGFACLSAYALAQHINRIQNLFTKPRAYRMIAYSLVGLISIGQYFMCKDLTQNYYEKKIDEELIDTHNVFLRGGKEFYSKILERNKALRTLMGKEGESLFSVLGNENYFVRNKHIPLVHRKKMFDDSSADNINEPLAS